MSGEIIAVIGATGAQGGGLVRAIARAGRFRARAITRNPDSAAARALKEQAAEIVAADLSDATSLKAAFAGAHGVYCVTNFWEHLSPDTELEQAANLVAAARDAGVSHVIWSTLEDTREFVPLDDPRMPTLMGRYKVPHFDAKGEANRLFIEAGLPTTFLYTSFYWDNLIYLGSGPQPGPDGTLLFTLPMGDAKLPGIASADIGCCAHGIFSAGKALIGREVGVAGEHLDGAGMAAALSDALGREVRHNPVTPEAYRNFGFPGAEDLANMYQFKRDFNESFCERRNVARTRELCPGLLDFRGWLAQHADEIPLTPST